MNWLERLRKKPRHVRDNYAFIGASSFLLVVAGIWALSLPLRFEDLNQLSVGAENIASVGGAVVEPVKEVNSGIFGTLNNFSESIIRFHKEQEEDNATNTESETASTSAVSNSPADFILSPEALEEARASGANNDWQPQTATSTPARTIRIATSTATTVE